MPHQTLSAWQVSKKRQRLYKVVTFQSPVLLEEYDKHTGTIELRAMK